MAQVQINTYQFEPHRTDSDGSDQDGEIENTSLNRLNDTSWQFLCIYSEINKYIYVFCVFKDGGGVVSCVSKFLYLTQWNKFHRGSILAVAHIFLLNSIFRWFTLFILI